MESVRYVFEGWPERGELWEVAPGVHWLRMPLPFQLNHINLWLLEDGDGWTIVDTGIARDEVKDAWERIFATHFDGKPLKSVAKGGLDLGELEDEAEKTAQKEAEDTLKPARDAAESKLSSVKSKAA